MKNLHIKLLSILVMTIIVSVTVMNIVMAQESGTWQLDTQKLWLQEESRIENLENQISAIDLHVTTARDTVEAAQVNQWHAQIIDLYTQIIDNSPLKGEVGFGSYYVNRAVYYGEGMQWDKAIADLNSVLAVDPNNLFALKNRAIINRQAGNLVNALTDLKTFLADVEQLEIKDSWADDVIFAKEQIDQLEALINEENESGPQQERKIYLPLINAGIV